eukprot:scaffold203188_cov17-Tisochrysis_lutea.AAC.1
MAVKHSVLTNGVAKLMMKNKACAGKKRRQCRRHNHSQGAHVNKAPNSVHEDTHGGAQGSASFKHVTEAAFYCWQAYPDEPALATQTTLVVLLSYSGSRGCCLLRPSNRLDLLHHRCLPWAPWAASVFTYVLCQNPSYHINPIPTPVKIKVHSTAFSWSNKSVHIINTKDYRGNEWKELGS